MPPEQTAISDPPAAPSHSPPRRKRRRGWLIVGKLLLVLVVCVVIARPMLPWAIRWYVNRTLDRSLIYHGKIGQIHLHLWRGAYTIEFPRIIKTTGDVPVPLFSARQVEFAIQWNALLHRKIVGQVVMDDPEINFVDASDPADAQTGAGGPWLQILRDLFPFKINQALINNGSIHFRTYQKAIPVDVYLNQLQATVDNLTNIGNDTTPLITTITARGLAMDQAKFQYQMKLDPFSYDPTFHLAVKLVGLDVTKTNDLVRAYGQFFFKQGWFDLVVEVDAKGGQLSGYVKPLFRNFEIFDLVQDIKNDKDVLQFFWHAVLGLTTEVLKNPPRDQFGTVIPFTQDLGGTHPDICATIGNVLRNGFVRAYLPRLENGSQGFDGMQFEPASASDPTTAEDEP